MFRDLQRDMGLAVVLLAGTGLLLYLLVGDLGAGLPDFPPARVSVATTPLPALERLPAVASAPRFPALTLSTNQPSMFFTTHFQPPSPQPPSTRKVDLTYLGYLQAGESPRQAYVLVGERLVAGALGSNVVADLRVMEIALRHVWLTNAAGATNQLEFKVKKTLEVPAQ